MNPSKEVGQMLASLQKIQRRNIMLTNWLKKQPTRRTFESQNLEQELDVAYGAVRTAQQALVKGKKAAVQLSSQL